MVRAQGYDATSTGGDVIFWCLGLQDGAPILKLVNHRRYALEAHHGDVRVLNPGLADRLDPTTSDIDPRAELRLAPTLAPGQGRRITTDCDGLADARHT